jgi:purine nucleosidase
MVKIHLDTDIGGDLDDLCALAMVLKWPGADLIGVTTNCDDGGRRAGYARYAPDLAGRTDVPVAAGGDIALGRYRVTPGLPPEDDYWPEPIEPVTNSLDTALDLLWSSIESGACIVAIGTSTNLALLEECEPGVLAEANLVLMGGYVFPPRASYPEWDRTYDWNVQLDVDAAHTVLQTADPLLVPLAVTVETALRRAHLPALRADGPLARLIAHQAEPFDRDEGIGARYGESCPAVPADLINFHHDPLACAIALGWRDGVEIQTLPIATTVEAGVLVQRVVAGAKPTRVVTAVDGPAFNDHWLQIVTASQPS